MVVFLDSRGNLKFKDLVDGIDRELVKLELENGGIFNDSVCVCVVFKCKSVEECELEYKCFKIILVEYNLFILKGSLEKDKFMFVEDKRCWECVINVVGLLWVNDVLRML